jgi:hypothetical protein
MWVRLNKRDRSLVIGIVLLLGSLLIYTQSQ